MRYSAAVRCPALAAPYRFSIESITIFLKSAATVGPRNVTDFLPSMNTGAAGVSPVPGSAHVLEDPILFLEDNGRLSPFLFHHRLQHAKEGIARNPSHAWNRQRTEMGHQGSQKLLDGDACHLN